MSIMLASWNVNSLTVRSPQVLDWLDKHPIDILGLQETKVPNEKFPEQLFKDLGLHVAYTGQKSYNGVALISRHPISDIYIEDLEIAERRIIAATIQGIRVINLYVPNGSDLASPKYAYKLSWLERVKTWLQTELIRYPKLAVMGDFNITPTDLDVHNPAEWVDCVLCSPAERQALTAIQALGLHDSYRHLNPTIQTFSWWDYRMANFRRNRGLRIDLILLSDLLIHSCKEAAIDSEPRKAERPSDHAPIWVRLQES